ncbi:hypothetical protein DSM3645_28157 [Blastopirellula marina DSM 3645]|uniref:Uncharacterized protein n=1 Tax=Blastopirellula marina DSM 3645 TaxID=314230 RepID=A3ZP57_9BACT|nr:hypothetical protein DSM3645_28157 [Blastopirellula marina DSM 3645]
MIYGAIAVPEYASRYYKMHLKKSDFLNFARLAEYTSNGFETVERINFQHGT